MMFGEKFRKKYALSEAGEANAKRGTFWTVVTNLVVMGGIGFLYLLMQGFMATLVDGAALPSALPYLAGVVVFVALSLFTHLQQYHYTYSVVYDEVGHARTSLAERLRKLPLSFFSHRDLAELTETMMSDVDRLEHVWSHVLGYLYGGYISTAIIAEVFVSDVSVQRLNEIFDSPVAAGREDFEPQGHDVVFDNVSFSYAEGDETTLRDVSFVAKEGEVTALVGPSGSGKSTCARLSGGERQRISIARALLKDAPVVLLDEATASLDVENETKVQAALSRLLAGKTVMVIAHRMRTVMGADKVVVLADGTVVEQGTPQELLAADGMFANMVRLQTESSGWSAGSEVANSRQ